MAAFHMNENFVFYSGKLICVENNLEKLSRNMVEKTYEKVISLDLSSNHLRTLEELKQFVDLEELILDNNQITCQIMRTLPLMQNLQILSLNKNLIQDLDNAIEILKARLPSLDHLSLLCNPVCPDQLNREDTNEIKDDNFENSEEDYKRYRLYVLHHMPHLTFLDFGAFSLFDRKQAMLNGAFLKVVRPVFNEINAVIFIIRSTKYFDRTILNTFEIILKNDFGILFQQKFISEDYSDSSNDLASSFNPLPKSLRSDAKKIKVSRKNAKCKYIYLGKNSEGNRFIRNTDL